jgi:hypothetical protein
MRWLMQKLCGLLLGHVIRRRYLIKSPHMQNMLVMCSLCGATLGDWLYHEQKG